MKRLSTIIILAIHVLCYGQDKIIETEISADNIFELSIIKVYPDSFPLISVVFQAKNEFGKPLWLLKKSELKIRENNELCEIVRLINISENTPINIGLVFDHSGSMFFNSSVGEDTLTVLSNLYFAGLPYPSEYKTSLDLAKEGVLEFIGDINETQDSILFAGFSDEVDHVLPLSSDPSDIQSFMKGLEPSGSTAFYDAIYLAMDSLIIHKSNPVIVAITDGQDNSSAHSYKEVIKKSKEYSIPIYIIGLGDVDEGRLKKICRKTDGLFYQTNDPNKLREIYANIKGQLKSIYQVDYTSDCKNIETNERTITFSFLNDTMLFSNPNEIYNLPKEAIEYLNEQESIRLAEIKAKEQETRDKWILGGALAGGILLLGFASFIIIKRRKAQIIKLEKLFPNPFDKEVTIHYQIPNKNSSAEINLLDMNGVQIDSYRIDPYENEVVLPLPELARGIYLFNISSGNDYSQTFKAVKR